MSSLASVRVLVVDDVRLNAEVTALLLRETFGVEATVVTSGAEALQAMAPGAFDLVFLDLLMPDLDGAEVARRARAAGYPGPIVALTASAMNDEIHAALAAGMNGVLGKPARPADLERVLAEHAPGRASRTSRAPAVHTSRAPAAALLPRLRAHFAEVAGPSAAEGLVTAAVESLSTSAIALDEALATMDRSAAHKAIHRLRGAALSAGLGDLEGRARAADRACVEGAEGWASQVAALERELGALLGQIRRAVPESERRGTPPA